MLRYNIFSARNKAPNQPLQRRLTQEYQRMRMEDVAFWRGCVYGVVMGFLASLLIFSMVCIN